MKHALSPHQKCSNGILITQVLSVSQTRSESLTLPRTVPALFTLSSSAIRRNRVASQHFEKLTLIVSVECQSSQTTKDHRNASVRFSPMFHIGQGNSGHLIMSLRIKSQYSPNYPSLLPKNNGASVIFSCYSRNRQGMTSTLAKCQKSLQPALVLHQHEGCSAGLHALARDCP